MAPPVSPRDDSPRACPNARVASMAMTVTSRRDDPGEAPGNELHQVEQAMVANRPATVDENACRLASSSSAPPSMPGPRPVSSMATPSIREAEAAKADAELFLSERPAAQIPLTRMSLMSLSLGKEAWDVPLAHAADALSALSIPPLDIPPQGRAQSSSTSEGAYYVEQAYRPRRPRSSSSSASALASAAAYGVGHGVSSWDPHKEIRTLIPSDWLRQRIPTGRGASASSHSSSHPRRTSSRGTLPADLLSNTSRYAIVHLETYRRGLADDSPQRKSSHPRPLRSSRAASAGHLSRRG